ncbi:MAG: hypothetical protein IJQ93_04220 [Bacteroidales bacterium]|nr:hypothetical protein [Bacteroidales bacterium]
MKKLAIIFGVAALCFAVSCNKNEKGEVLSPDEQKEEVGDVIVEAASMIKLANWQGTADLLAQSAMTVASSDPDNESVLGYLEGVSSKWAEDNKIDLTALSGKFTISDEVIAREDASGLNAECVLEDGTKMAAKVTVKNSKTVLAIPNPFKGSVEPDALKAVAAPATTSLVVPSSIVANVTANGKEAFGIAVKDVVLNFKGEEPTPDGTYSLTAAVNAADYELALTKAKYSPTEVGLALNFKKGSTSIIKANLSGTGKLSFKTEKDEETGEEYVEGFDAIGTKGKVKAEISLLGKVSLKGFLNYTQVVETYTYYAENPPKTEEQAQVAYDELMKWVDLGLYIDGTRQGYLALIPDTEEGTPVPIIKFDDGSEYQFPEEYGQGIIAPIMSQLGSILSEIETYIDTITGGGE